MRRIYKKTADNPNTVLIKTEPTPKKTYTPRTNFRQKVDKNGTPFAYAEGSYWWAKKSDKIGKKTKKKKRKQQKVERRRKKQFQEGIQRFAKELRSNTPQSEIWFSALFDQTRHFRHCQHNVVFGNYIPDFINHSMRYIIEVDGSIHDTEVQRIKDNKKNIYYARKSYRVFRIKAYDFKSYQIFIAELEQYLIDFKTNKDLAMKNSRNVNK